MNEINRCICKVDNGSYEEEDKVNFTKPMVVTRCNLCKGLLGGYSKW